MNTPREREAYRSTKKHHDCTKEKAFLAASVLMLVVVVTGAFVFGFLRMGLFTAGVGGTEILLTVAMTACIASAVCFLIRKK